MSDEPEKNEEDKDVELDLMAEQEFLRLVRQFRVMEGDKEAYTDEATKALRRQRKIISDLEIEKNDIIRVLTVTKSKTNCRREEDNSTKIVLLTEEQERVMTSISQEKEIVNDLDREIQRIERQIGMQRKQLYGVKRTNSGKKPSSRDKKDISQRIVLLENRLDGVMIGFNATLSQNAKIRTEIDHLVQERSTFNDLIAKLQKKIASNKKTISDITELSIQAFDQRDESQSKIAALKERNEKDAAQCNGELKELQRNLDHDEKLKDFLFQKSNERIFNTGFRSGEEEKEAAAKKAAANEEKFIETTAKYKQAFDKIRKIVGSESNLDKIVADFIKVEDQNFALFNYITEMNNQVEGLQESITRLKNDIKEAKGRGDERERLQREQLQLMEDKLKKSIHESESAETKLSLMESVIKKLIVGTEELYKISDCGSTPILSLMGITKEVDLPSMESFVTEENIIMYLDMIYERVIELKGIEQFIDRKERKGSTVGSQMLARKAHGTKPTLPHDNRKLSKLLSSSQLMNEGCNGVGKTVYSAALAEDHESRPFDMSALKARALAISQRERREEMNLNKLQLKGDLGSGKKNNFKSKRKS